MQDFGPVYIIIFGNVVELCSFSLLVWWVIGDNAEIVNKKKRSNYRNQCIANKFFVQKPEIKDTHPHIVEWFDSTDCRATKTEIIENCFKKDGKAWKLDLEKPYFSESRKGVWAAGGPI